ncbi:MAG: RIP metalloprotease RseP [Betaproteobacteria bacterium]|nr:RIP metalloprotease RseP [Betaproteobacteria bacterium]MBU6512697.1 RIP metalloprotease RseP [Betaproteobacteria bacterium]MDE1955526.1 RIP metalloprotease RseP [Betaproteobacteria bacterium]MDE2152498.1 RIP metalloprotease RseP [Betaproteobacteria bacterium]MDE2478064.1 RIP metalloprotease RseP [Betaproteobacteria bacterium]
MLTLFAFLFALALLIAVHEAGHYLAALSCGIRVLKFSIGFGPPLLQRRIGADATEFVLASVPLGGYVRMLDEREAPVEPAQLHRAFNRQNPWKRSWVVAAGPVANLLLAVLLFAAVSMMGVSEPLALLGAPAPGTPAAAAGVRAGQQVLATTIAGDTRAVRSWPQLALRLQEAALDGRGVDLRVRDAGGEHDLRLDLRAEAARAGQTDFLRGLGLRLQPAPVRVQRALPGQPAELAGLQAGDLIVGVAGPGGAARPGAPGAAAEPFDARQLLGAISASGGQELRLKVLRASRTLTLTLRPRRETDAQGRAQWRIGALLDDRLPSTLVRLGPSQALREGVRRTWQLSVLSLRTLGRMVLGQASLDQLSGPVTIADYAGRSAALGLAPYLNFLAVVSLSLGVLNLLPIPVLDGGHLLYYAVEILSRRKVPQRVQERLQQGGLALIALMIAVALYNDIARVLGPFH